MKKMILVLSLILLFSTVGCSSNDDNNASMDEIPKMVDVDLIVEETVSANEPVLFQAEVSQGDEMVEDADEVVFEIWNVTDGRDNSEMIEAEHKGNGIYSIERTFTNENVYYVQVHVTARNLHVMPLTNFVVGELSEEEAKRLIEQYEMKKDEEKSKHHMHDEEEENHQG